MSRTQPRAVLFVSAAAVVIPGCESGSGALSVPNKARLEKSATGRLSQGLATHQQALDGGEAARGTPKNLAGDLW